MFGKFAKLLYDVFSWAMQGVVRDILPRVVATASGVWMLLKVEIWVLFEPMLETMLQTFPAMQPPTELLRAAYGYAIPWLPIPEMLAIIVAFYTFKLSLITTKWILEILPL